jgi:hypothetical protein
LNQLYEVSVLGTSETHDCFVECCQLAVVMFGETEQVGVSDLFGAVHAALKRRGGFKNVDGRGPEEMAGQSRKLEQEQAGIPERVSFADEKRGAGDAEESSLRKGASCKCFLRVGIEPRSRLHLIGVQRPEKRDKDSDVEQVASHQGSASARRTSSVVIRFPVSGTSAVGKPSTNLILGGLGSVRSISSETAWLNDRPVAPIMRPTIAAASGDNVTVVLRGASFLRAELFDALAEGWDRDFERDAVIT